MKFNLKYLSTPFMAFAIVWLIGLSTYSLGWSNSFPALSSGLFIFILIAILLSFFVSFYLSRKNYFLYRPLSKILNTRVLLLTNTFLWILNFAYSRIPLFEISTGVDFTYTDFGIPIVIVIATCFNSFLCVYFFHCYLCYKKKKYLFYYFICICFFVLAYSRGLIVVTLVSTTFLWLSANGDKINTKYFYYFLFALIFSMYAFGYAGNIRTAQAVARDDKQGNYTYNDQYILQIADASKSFTDNLIPNEFFWTYLYIASPISNLQYNVSRKVYFNYKAEDFISLIINETLYETFSKRVAEYFPEIKRKEPELLISNLTVTTAFARSYLELGYLGLCIMLFYIIVLPIFYIKFIGFKSSYLPVAMAILCSIYFFTIFDNMFSFVGTGPQLLFPLFFEFRDRFLKNKNALAQWRKFQS